jgi:glycosyltransferase involved in cell wall biosynthesis
MRTLLFSNLFPTSADPLRGVFTLRLAQALQQLCTLRVAVPLPWFPSGRLARRFFPHHAHQFGGLAPSLHWDSVTADYWRYPLIPKLPQAFHPILMSMGIASRARHLLAEQHIDVINAHWMYPDGVVAAQLGRQFGIPVVLTGLGCDVNDKLLVPYKHRAILAAVHSAAAVTTVSRPLADVLIAAGADAAKITVIGNGVDTGVFKPGDRAAARLALGIPAAERIIVCIARLSEEKGVHILVQALHRLRAIEGNVSVVLIGAGAAEPQLRELAEQQQVTEFVKFAGTMQQSQIAVWLAAADVACMPSLREGHPNAAMEALASGRPLVASAVGALPELINEHSGLLCPPGDPAALAAALASALQRSWSAERIAAQVAGRGWRQSAETYVEIYERVLRQRSMSRCDPERQVCAP